MADGYFPTLVSKDKDPNAVTDPIFVELTDGTNAVTVTAGNLGVVVNNGTGAAAVNIQDGGNSITVDGAVTVSGSVTVSNFPAFPALQDVNVTEWDSVAVGAPSAYGTAPGAVNVIGVNAYITNTVPVTGTFWQTTQPISGTVTANQGTANSIANSWPVEITNGTNVIGTAAAPIAISATAAANSAVNPIYVQSAVAAVTGAVCDYATATVSANSSSNHDYTVVTSMKLQEVSFSSSGGGKVELKVGPLATLVSKWVGFVPKEGGTVTITFPTPITVPTTSTGTVRLVMSNRENQSQDLYSTIVGIDA